MSPLFLILHCPPMSRRTIQFLQALDVCPHKCFNYFIYRVSSWRYNSGVRAGSQLEGYILFPIKLIHYVNMLFSSRKLIIDRNIGKWWQEEEPLCVVNYIYVSPFRGQGPHRQILLVIWQFIVHYKPNNNKYLQ